jgi:hypothetical protein
MTHLPFDFILGSHFSGKSISASLTNISGEMSNGMDENDMNCEKKDNHGCQYPVNKTKTKVIAVSVGEKSNSAVEEAPVGVCETLTTTTTATAITVTSSVPAANTSATAAAAGKSTVIVLSRSQLKD